MKKRCLLAVVPLLAAVLAVPAPARAAKYKIRWLIGHQNLDFFEDAAADFKKTVETKSRGDIEVIIERTGDSSLKLPPPQEIAATVAKGEAEMGHSFTDIVGAVDPRFHAFEVPFLVRDYKHMEGIVEGPLGQEMLAGLRAKGLVGLSFTYSGGANGVATSSRELRSPADLKGLRVGVYGDSVDAAWLEALGATPVALGHADESVLARERAGDLDAAVITWRNFERAALDKDFKDMSLVGSTYLVSVTYVNAKFFDSLPKEHQALLREASRFNGRVERAKTIELNELTKRKVMAYGVKPVHLSAEGRAAFAKALAPAYAAIAKELGKDFLDKVRKTGDGPMPKGDLAPGVHLADR